MKKINKKTIAKIAIYVAIAACVAWMLYCGWAALHYELSGIEDDIEDIIDAVADILKCLDIYAMVACLPVPAIIGLKKLLKKISKTDISEEKES